MTLSPRDLDAIVDRAQQAQGGRIRPGQVPHIARMSTLTCQHWARSREDVLTLAAEVRRLRDAVEVTYRYWCDENVAVPPDLADWSHGLGMAIVAAAMEAGVCRQWRPAVHADRPVEPMPHGPHLVPADRDSLTQWIEQGIPFDRSTVAALLAIAQTAVAEHDRLLEALTDGPLHVQDQAAAAELLDLIRRRAGNRAQLIELADRAFGGGA